MSKPFIDSQTVKTIFQGALGALTFGAYHQFNTNKIMELNNEVMDARHKEDIKMLLEKIEKLEAKDKARWW